MKDEHILRAYENAAPDSGAKARIWANLQKEAALQARKAPANQQRGGAGTPVSIVARKERPFLQRFGLAAACVALTVGVLGGGWLGYQKWMHADPADTVPGSSGDYAATSTEQTDPTRLQAEPIWLDGDPCYGTEMWNDGTNDSVYYSFCNDRSILNGTENRIVDKLDDGRFQIVDYMGHEIAVIESEEEFGPFYDGVAVFKQNGKYGLIDSNGNCVVPAEYDGMGDISEGLVKVCKDGRFGYIDTAGQIVISLEYDDADICQEGLVSVMLGGKWGSLDQNGRVVIPLEYDHPIVANNGYAFADLGNRSYKLFSTSGQEIALEKALSSYRYFEEGFCFVGWGCVMPTLEAEGFGFIDSTGQVVIEGDFDDGSDFHYGLAAVAKNGKWGFIDTAGVIVIPMEYDDARGFGSEGRAIVGKNGKYGVIDSDGQVILPLEYDVCYDYTEGLAAVNKDGKWGFVDVNGQIVIPLEYDAAESFDHGFAPVCKDGKCGYIDRSGAIAVPIEYDGCITRALLGQVTLVKQGERWGIVWLTDLAEEVIENTEPETEVPETSEASVETNPSAAYDVSDLIPLDGDPFPEDDCFSTFNAGNGIGEDAVLQITTKRSDGKIRIFDYAGQRIGDFDYDEIESFSEGLAAVSHDGKWGFVDRNYQLVIPMVYDQVGVFSNGLADVKQNGAWGYLDRQGQIVIPPQYEIAAAFRDGIAPVRSENEAHERKMGAINMDGQLVLPLEYDSVLVVEHYVRVKIEDQYGYFDTEGHAVIPVQYDFVDSFDGGLCCVMKDGAYGYCNTDGQVVIPMQYDHAAHFSEGLAAVCMNEKWGYINSDGQTVIPLEYDSAEAFSGGFATVEKNGAFGVIDANGQVVIPLEYDEARFDNGLFVVGQNERCGVISANGQIVIPMEYDVVMGFPCGLFLVEKDEKWGYYDSNGLIVIPVKYQNCSYPIHDELVLVKTDAGYGMLHVTRTSD